MKKERVIGIFTTLQQNEKVRTPYLVERYGY